MNPSDGFPSCPNCEQPLEARFLYCPNCGEKNSDHRQSIKHLFEELFEHTIHFDSKIWRTLKSLYTRPGALPVMYNQGKRTSFVAPLRLYIFVSFIFFLVIPTSGTQDETKAGPPSHDKVSFTFGPIKSQELIGLNEQQIDELMVQKNMKPTGMRRHMVHHIAQYANGGLNFYEEFLHKWFKTLSYLMFLLMPLFALFTYLLFAKPRIFFVEHLVFALYFHSFYLSFLALSKGFALLFHFPLFFSPAILVCLFFILVYLFVGLRTMFGQGVAITALKTVATFILYWFSVLVCSLFTYLIIFLFL